ncbi:hypothetical protein GGR53DRAFT_514717, partial [Hypoxylon sp. FL1150]
MSIPDRLETSIYLSKRQFPDTMTPRQRPIQKLAASVSQCSAEAAIYGKCIVADYNSVHKDKCATEFLKFKDCFLKASKKTR